MTNQKHPIPSPPPELVEQWASVNGTHYEDLATLCEHIATQAARWGADQELEACATYIARNWKLCLLSDELICARRPKPPTLKEQALDALREAESTGCLYVNGRSDLIRRALEALPSD
jgi:hypothetical protein